MGVFPEGINIQPAAIYVSPYGELAAPALALAKGWLEGHTTASHSCSAAQLSSTPANQQTCRPLSTGMHARSPVHGWTIYCLSYRLRCDVRMQASALPPPASTSSPL